MYHSFIRENKTLVSIFLFLIIFGIIVLVKPAFLFNKDGSLREFGLGYKNKTILPLWLFSLVLGILCYVLIQYYVNYGRMFI